MSGYGVYVQKLHSELAGTLLGDPVAKATLNIKLMMLIKQEGRKHTTPESMGPGLSRMVQFLVDRAESDVLVALPADTRELWLSALRVVPVWSIKTSAAIREGALRKKGRRFGTEMSRWYVLNVSHLFYYEVEKDKGDHSARGMIALGGVNHVMCRGMQDSEAWKQYIVRQETEASEKDKKTGKTTAGEKWTKRRQDLERRRTKEFKKLEDHEFAFEYRGKIKVLIARDADEARSWAQDFDIAAGLTREIGNAVAQAMASKRVQAGSNDLDELGEQVQVIDIADLTDDDVDPKEDPLAVRGHQQNAEVLSLRHQLFQELQTTVQLNRKDTYRCLIDFKKEASADTPEIGERNTHMGAADEKGFVNAIVRVCPICSFIFPIGLSSSTVNTHIDECVGLSTQVQDEWTDDQWLDTQLTSTVPGTPGTMATAGPLRRRCPICHDPLDDRSNSEINEHIDACLLKQEQTTGAHVSTGTPLHSQVDWANDDDVTGGFAKSDHLARVASL